MARSSTTLVGSRPVPRASPSPEPPDSAAASIKTWLPAGLTPVLSVSPSVSRAEGGKSGLSLCLNTASLSKVPVAHSCILATQEAEIRRIAV
jgi:hypothetical protein